MEQDIYIGTMVGVNENIVDYIKKILPYGFESIALTFGHDKEDMMDPVEVAEKIMPIVKQYGVKIGAIEAYGNPLLDTVKAEKLRNFFYRLIDSAHLYETDVVAGFAGRVEDVPVQDSIPKFKEVWTPICEKAGEKNVRVAFENCTMGGNWYHGGWNIAFNPDAWELMFNAITLPNVGLEWEPTHQMTQLIDPIPQLRDWTHKIFHLHGKDAKIRHDLVAKYGVNSSKYVVEHRHPGFGDCNWIDIISELRRYGFKGSIDIEGWHDPVYRGEREMTGQVFALNYLKHCRCEYFA